MSKPANTESEKAMQTTSHVCAGCGGSGYQRGNLEHGSCVVCWDGKLLYSTGRISDVMPAKDHKADALTAWYFHSSRGLRG